MEETFKTRQLTEYRSLSDGRSGCLFYVASNNMEKTHLRANSPALYFIDSPSRKGCQKPFSSTLTNEELEAVYKAKPVLIGYEAWVTAAFLDGIDIYSSYFEIYEKHMITSPDVSHMYINKYLRLEKYEYEAAKSLLLNFFKKKELMRLCYLWSSYQIHVEEILTKNPKIFTNNRFDAVKALWDISDINEHNIQCSNTVSDGIDIEVPCNDDWKERLRFTFVMPNSDREFGNIIPAMTLAISHYDDVGLSCINSVDDLYDWQDWELIEQKENLFDLKLVDRDEVEDTPIQTDNFFHISGFTVVLFNLARNLYISNCAIELHNEPWRQPFPMPVDRLCFETIGIPDDIYKSYYAKMQPIYREMFMSDKHRHSDEGLDKYIAEREEEYYQEFLKSNICYDLDYDQLNEIDEYHQGFMEHLSLLIGEEPTPVTVKDKQPEQLNDEKVHRYFSTNYTEQQAEQNFTILVKEGYFHPNSKLQDFLYYCGVDNSVPPSAQLIWMKTQTLLAYFIHDKLGKNNLNDLWKITKEVFVLKNRTQPNTDSMKHDFSKGISCKSESEWKDLAKKLK
ncbi:MAG: hypothetical protein IKN59_01410 [Paludibacteraceae bacterium]|nr:hypothetical protein [Paludibacteraceae bacterium]